MVSCVGVEFQAARAGCLRTRGQKASVARVSMVGWVRLEVGEGPGVQSMSSLEGNRSTGRFEAEE